jgi:hypothetical protein
MISAEFQGSAAGACCCCCVAATAAAVTTALLLPPLLLLLLLCRSVHGGCRDVLTMGPGAFFGERNLADSSFTWLASMVSRGRVSDHAYC